MSVVHDPAVARVVLAALLIATVVGIAIATTRARRAQVGVGGVLALLSAAWLVLDEPFEGPTLWAPMAGHGLTVGDLLAVPAAAVAVMLVITSRRRYRRPPAVTEEARRRAFAHVA